MEAKTISEPRPVTSEVSTPGAAVTGRSRTTLTRTWQKCCARTWRARLLPDTGRSPGRTGRVRFYLNPREPKRDGLLPPRRGGRPRPRGGSTGGKGRPACPPRSAGPPPPPAGRNPCLPGWKAPSPQPRPDWALVPAGASARGREGTGRAGGRGCGRRPAPEVGAAGRGRPPKRAGERAPGASGHALTGRGPGSVVRAGVDGGRRGSTGLGRAASRSEDARRPPTPSPPASGYVAPLKASREAGGRARWAGLPPPPAGPGKAPPLSPWGRGAARVRQLSVPSGPVARPPARRARETRPRPLSSGRFWEGSGTASSARPTGKPRRGHAGPGDAELRTPPSGGRAHPGASGPSPSGRSDAAAGGGAGPEHVPMRLPQRQP